MPTWGKLKQYSKVFVLWVVYKKKWKGQCFDKIVCFNRQVTLFEEFVLLKEYEKREDVMEAKVTGKQQEKLEMQAKVRTVDRSLDQ